VTVYEQLRDALGAKLAEVSGIGVVHNRERLILDWKQYLELFVNTLPGEEQRRARGWWIEREAVESSNFSMGGMVTIRRRNRFICRGILAVQDSADSSAMFHNVVDRCLRAVDSESAYGVPGLLSVGPTSARVIEPRQFGSVLCHYAELETVMEVLEEVANG
jgi:hypothetical protein